MSSETAVPASDSTALLRWFVIIHGGLAIIFGLLLVVVPGRTLAFVATLIGAYLIVYGLVQAATAMLTSGLAREQRFAGAAIGALAVIVGAVVIARPEGSVKTVAVITGIYLIVMGVATAILGLGATRGLALLRGGLGVAAGIALLVWPDVTVGVIATLAGIFMLLRGAAEMVGGFSLGPSRS
jgi:uncharacterized membrane protein HdeD (DUF308 family)